MSCISPDAMATALHSTTSTTAPTATKDANTARGDPRTWTIAQVQNWCRQVCRLPQVAPALKTQEVDGEVLLEFVDHDVIQHELGIKPFGARVKLLNGIRKLRQDYGIGPPMEAYKSLVRSVVPVDRPGPDALRHSLPLPLPVPVPWSVSRPDDSVLCGLAASIHTTPTQYSPTAPCLARYAVPQELLTPSRAPTEKGAQMHPLLRKPLSKAMLHLPPTSTATSDIYFRTSSSRLRVSTVHPHQVRSAIDQPLSDSFWFYRPAAKRASASSTLVQCRDRSSIQRVHQTLGHDQYRGIYCNVQRRMRRLLAYPPIQRYLTQTVYIPSRDPYAPCFIVDHQGHVLATFHDGSSAESSSFDSQLAAAGTLEGPAVHSSHNEPVLDLCYESDSNRLIDPFAHGSIGPQSQKGDDIRWSDATSGEHGSDSNAHDDSRVDHTLISPPVAIDSLRASDTAEVTHPATGTTPNAPQPSQADPGASQSTRLARFQAVTHANVDTESHQSPLMTATPTFDADGILVTSDDPILPAYGDSDYGSSELSSSDLASDAEPASSNAPREKSTAHRSLSLDVRQQIVDNFIANCKAEWAKHKQKAHEARQWYIWQRQHSHAHILRAEKERCETDRLPRDIDAVLATNVTKRAQLWRLCSTITETVYRICELDWTLALIAKPCPVKPALASAATKRRNIAVNVGPNKQQRLEAVQAAGTALQPSHRAGMEIEVSDKGVDDDQHLPLPHEMNDFIDDSELQPDDREVYWRYYASGRRLARKQTGQRTVRRRQRASRTPRSTSAVRSGGQTSSPAPQTSLMEQSSPLAMSPMPQSPEPIINEGPSFSSPANVSNSPVPVPMTPSTVERPKGSAAPVTGSPKPQPHARSTAMSSRPRAKATNLHLDHLPSTGVQSTASLPPVRIDMGTIDGDTTHSTPRHSRAPKPTASRQNDRTLASTTATFHRANENNRPSPDLVFGNNSEDDIVVIDDDVSKAIDLSQRPASQTTEPSTVLPLAALGLFHKRARVVANGVQSPVRPNHRPMAVSDLYGKNDIKLTPQLKALFTNSSYDVILAKVLAHVKHLACYPMVSPWASTAPSLATSDQQLVRELFASFMAFYRARPWPDGGFKVQFRAYFDAVCQILPDATKRATSLLSLSSKTTTSGDGSGSVIPVPMPSMVTPLRVNQEAHLDSDGEGSATPRTFGRKNIRKIREEAPEVVRRRANAHQKHKDWLKRRDELKQQAVPFATNATRERTSTANTALTAPKPGCPRVVINFGHDSSEEDIVVPPFLAKHLKKHQVEGIQFMWKNLAMCDNGGCILAHAMGLGKTFQVIVLMYMLAREARRCNPAVPEEFCSRRTLILCPTTLKRNWLREIHRWVPAAELQADLGGVYSIDAQSKSFDQKLTILHEWFEEGGILMAGYQSFRDMVAGGASNSRTQATDAEREAFHTYLLDPGPSLVIADEGHLIKNPASQISLASKAFRTQNRVCLTGYPLQNSLEEYWCMVDFVRPLYLGSLADFRNAYLNPIENGQYPDSTSWDRRLARRKLYVLQDILDPIVLRREAQVLVQELPPKYEFVLSCRLTDLQYSLYNVFLLTSLQLSSSTATPNLVTNDFILRSICNHPQICRLALMKRYGMTAPTTAGPATPAIASPNPNAEELIEEIQDDNPEALANTVKALQPQVVTVTNECLNRFDTPEDIKHSFKMQILLAIVLKCKAIGDKVLIFSRSLPTLDFLEELFSGRVPGALERVRYLRLDGVTAPQIRQTRVDKFNDDPNLTAFLVSSATGSLGLNVVSANRVVLCDVGWNPSWDQQAIARAYRYGQTRPVFVYRLSTCGTMEDKVFKNNVHKMGMSKRVVDRRNVEKLFTKKQLKTYYELPPQDPPCLLSFRTMPEHLNKDECLKTVLNDYQHGIIDITEQSSYLAEDMEKMTAEDIGEAQIMLQLERDRLAGKGKNASPVPTDDGHPAVSSVTGAMAMLSPPGRPDQPVPGIPATGSLTAPTPWPPSHPT
ncbi:hypothetical protein H4R34_000711 [Dimargaris verticillata]|uniref:P-loop containing nucleoside triphosphate hydrolase protein n=1 Tax=Dimargaris verticillata TaxID=2761393 RepID=A0A9W8EB00_9FUNG|nr:hypothetical protein H4R34_000711 [Dimargaris verticillata]